jgi:hypothetical protein
MSELAEHEDRTWKHYSMLQVWVRLLPHSSMLWASGKGY